LFCVTLLPTSEFGFEENYLAARFTYVDFPNPKQDDPFDIKADCPNLIEGINKICNWISNL
jgi:hypothetical protein